MRDPEAETSETGNCRENEAEVGKLGPGREAPQDRILFN